MGEASMTLVSGRVMAAAQTDSRPLHYPSGKRLFHFAITGIALLVLLPLMLVIAVLMVLLTPGSPIF